MATRSSRTPRAETTPPDTTPPYTGHHDHSFTLQAVMDLKGDVGRLSNEVSNLGKRVDSMAKTLGRIEKAFWMATAVVLLVGGLSVWLINLGKDVAITYLKATSEATTKLAAPSASQQPPQSQPNPAAPAVSPAQR